MHTQTYIQTQTNKSIHIENTRTNTRSSTNLYEKEPYFTLSKSTVNLEIPSQNCTILMTEYPEILYS